MKTNKRSSLWGLMKNNPHNQRKLSLFTDSIESDTFDFGEKLMYKTHRKSVISTVITASIVTILASSAFAASPTNNGTKPQGKPFIQLGSEIIQVEDAVSTLEERVDIIVGRVDTLEGLVSANTSAVSTLQQQNLDLQTQIDSLGTDVGALETRIGNLENENQSLQDQIGANSGDITNLEAEIAANTSLINSLNLELNGLQGLESRIADNMAMIELINSRLSQFNTDLASKQNNVTGTCSAGWSIRSVLPSGGVVCEFDDVGAVGSPHLVSYSQYSSWWNYGGTYTGYLSCASGYTLSGGGFTNVNSESSVISSYSNGNTQYVSVYNPNFYYDYWEVRVQCIKVVN